MPTSELGYTVDLPMSRLASSRWALWQYWAHRALQRLSGGRAALHVHLFCAQPVGSHAHDAIKDDPSCVTRRVQPDDPLLAGAPRPQHILRSRFAESSTCDLTTVKGEFAGYIWLARGTYVEDEFRCRFVLPAEPASVWDYDVFVVPRFRTGRTLARMWKSVDRQLAAEGVQWSYSRISLFNPTSVRTHERMGARLVARGWFLVLGPLQLAVLTIRPFVNLGMSSSPGPELRLPVP
jgi:hypothetical protein